MIDATFFTGNRQRLLDELQETSVVVLTAYTGMQFTGDASATFSQESNFWYVTGIDEPDWTVITTRQKSWLVMPDMSEVHRVFDGGLSAEAARHRSGVDEVIDTAAATELLTRLGAQHEAVGSLGKDPHASYYNFSLNPAPQKLLRRLRGIFAQVHDIRPTLARMRAIKQPVEVDAIERAVRLTVLSFTQARQELRHTKHEYELEAVFTSAFRRHNARHAYDPIVAGGANACTLHYIKNSEVFTEPSLVLIDIGARVDGYAADVTRTYGVGQVTARQAAVHAAVTRAQQEIIALLRPGLSLREYQDVSDTIMKSALREVGMLEHEGDYRRYFPHAMSHGLGVDVHDSLGGYEAFRPGMVLTVEPGIYIPEEEIGVRLEDDILITETGYRNLSESLPLDM